MSNSIVQVNVSQNSAPAPSTLQRTGAMISQGGTTGAVGSLALLTQLSDLTSLLSASKALTSLTWSGSVVTATTAVAHGWNIGDVVQAVIAGETPIGYNGTFAITILTATTFSYPLASNPGAQSFAGTVVLYAESEILAMATTFFTQGTGLSVYVLELGEGTPAAGVIALTTFINANANTVYSYLVPVEWDAVASFLTFLALYTTTTTKTYFFVTTTTANQGSYPTTMKDVFKFVPSPVAAVTEFGCAAPFYVTLNYNPGSSNRVTPLSFSFLYGVTAYPLKGNSAVLATLKAANCNFVDTGAEGGLSNTILKWGRLADGNPFNYWYSIDWVQINLDLTLANVVINGSNNTLAPLYYNQQGINVLQAAATQVFATAITYGLATGTIVDTQLPAATFALNYQNGLYKGLLAINAESFPVYKAENVSDYSIGKYAGLAGVYTPLRGFESIIFNLTATTFP
jgi:hypothetical protein